MTYPKTSAQDVGLFDYDAASEDTRLPTDLLWGPGSHREAINWLDEDQPQRDAVVRPPGVSGNLVS